MQLFMKDRMTNQIYQIQAPSSNANKDLNESINLRLYAKMESLVQVMQMSYLVGDAASFKDALETYRASEVPLEPMQLN